MVITAQHLRVGQSFRSVLTGRRGFVVGLLWFPGEGQSPQVFMTGVDEKVGLHPKVRVTVEDFA